MPNSRHFFKSLATDTRRSLATAKGGSEGASEAAARRKNQQRRQICGLWGDGGGGGQREREVIGWGAMGGD